MIHLLPTCSKALDGYDSCGKRWYLSLVIAVVSYIYIYIYIRLYLTEQNEKLFALRFFKYTSCRMILQVKAESKMYAP
jgi:hypothetical protein